MCADSLLHTLRSSTTHSDLAVKLKMGLGLLSYGTCGHPFSTEYEVLLKRQCQLGSGGSDFRNRDLRHLLLCLLIHVLAPNLHCQLRPQSSHLPTHRWCQLWDFLRFADLSPLLLLAAPDRGTLPLRVQQQEPICEALRGRDEVWEPAKHSRLHGLNNRCLKPRKFLEKKDQVSQSIPEESCQGNRSRKRRKY